MVSSNQTREDIYNDRFISIRIVTDIMRMNEIDEWKDKGMARLEYLRRRGTGIVVLAKRPHRDDNALVGNR